ncbi:TraB/VirB10 family protein [Simkania negevensis]|uniref:Conjugal transfer pore protein TraB n=1 Tax=Simkania negevensis (strain ATCC VR-1471 / DSM 27360 / Z) TaxID=331113 RepID=F8L2Z0_SIMNZ|nr:TraB/VirB10 family protein [Simkania negevensis]CCB87836.1 conjugal transfer pore protein TraB [Simkania negevensis Z]
MVETKEESSGAKKLKKLMDSKKSPEAKRLKKQWLLIGIVVIAMVFIVSQVSVIFGKRSTPSFKKEITESDVVSTGLEPDLSRIGDLELTQEELEKKVESLTLWQEENRLKTQEVLQTQRQTAEELKELKSLLLRKMELQDAKIATLTLPSKQLSSSNSTEVSMESIELEQVTDRKHVAEVIPAGTIVRCVVVSGASVSTGIGTPMGSRKILLKPTSNGWLPAGVRVALKDSLIMCSATANLAEERVYVRGDRMNLTYPDGYTITTEIAAYVSGEDGQEGVRCALIDKNWSSTFWAGLASGVGEIGKAMQSGNPLLDLPKLGKTDTSFIINLDTLKQGGIQGGSTALDKMTEHLLKEKEKNAPFLILDSMRHVDLIFLHDCEIGENNIKEKMRIKRALENERRKKVNATNQS